MLARTSLHNHTHQPTTAVTYEGWDAIMVLTQSVSGMGTIFIFMFLLVTGASIVVNLLVAVIMIKFQEAKEMEDEHGLEEEKEKERQQILLQKQLEKQGLDIHKKVRLVLTPKPHPRH